MVTALSLTELKKSYGVVRALDGLNLEVPEGVICGFIGPNGAGKTTTFGVAGGLIRPDSGQVNILERGHLVAGREPGVFAMLPQDCELPPQVPVQRFLEYLGRLQGLTAVEARRAADQRLDEVALRDRATDTIKQLSHGMRRRVQIAQALLGDPKVILLDEPTSGLDPELVIRMRDLFVQQRGHRTLVISSHNLRELEAVCDFVAFVHKGRCLKSGSLDEVTDRGTLLRYTVERSFDLAHLSASFPDLEISAQGLVLTVRTAAPAWTAAKINAAIVPVLLEREAGLLEIRAGQSLED
ncbi:MAG: ABC transporter ATP-binding protein, partial [Myxococcota bacterium]